MSWSAQQPFEHSASLDTDVGVVSRRRTTRYLHLYLALGGPGSHPLQHSSYSGSVAPTYAMRCRRLWVSDYFGSETTERRPASGGLRWSLWLRVEEIRRGKIGRAGEGARMSRGSFCKSLTRAQSWICRDARLTSGIRSYASQATLARTPSHTLPRATRTALSTPDA